jgi:hypothetical protein
MLFVSLRGMLFKVHMVSDCYNIGINSSEMWCCVTRFMTFRNSVMASSSKVWRFVNITEYCCTHLHYSLAPHIDLVDTAWCWLIQAPKSSSCTHITYNQSQPFAVPQVSVSFSYFVITWSHSELCLNWTHQLHHTWSLNIPFQGHIITPKSLPQLPQLVHHPHQPCVNQ